VIGESGAEVFRCCTRKSRLYVVQGGIAAKCACEWDEGSQESRLRSEQQLAYNCRMRASTVA
jgi:hypothetical protein